MSSINVEEEEWKNFDDIDVTSIPNTFLDTPGFDYVELGLLILLFVNFYWFISIHCISKMCTKEKEV